MLGKKLVPVWIGIIVLSGIFLMGQESWIPTPPPTCPDSDGDGYGRTTSEVCAYPELDCCDDDPDVYPGAPELCDGKDNQCDGDTGYGVIDEGCDPPDMAQIPSGCFDMGDAFDEATTGLDEDELPVHGVCISAFEIDYHLVTNAEYAECVDAGACTPGEDPAEERPHGYYSGPCYANFPVSSVDWFDSTDYCTWAGKRLPTEAEYEYAARGGLEGKRSPWGDSISGADANYANSGDPWDGSPWADDTTPVEYYPPNGYGLFDMVGNVWHWVNDWYQYDYYAASPPNDPQGPASGTKRIVRGGSFYHTPYFLRVSNRLETNPVLGLITDGFRCVRSGDCVDEDHDGYGDPDSSDCIYSGLDCNDTASGVNPGAMEICDSGADEDCDTLIDGDDPDCQ